MPKTSSYRAAPAPAEIEVGEPLKLDLPGGRSAIVQRFGEAIRVAIGRRIKRTQTDAHEQICNFFVPVDCATEIAAALCTAAGVVEPAPAQQRAEGQTSGASRERESRTMKGWPNHVRHHVKRGVVNPACLLCCPPQADD